MLAHNLVASYLQPTLSPRQAGVASLAATPRVGGTGAYPSSQLSFVSQAHSSSVASNVGSVRIAAHTNSVASNLSSVRIAAPTSQPQAHTSSVASNLGSVRIAASPPQPQVLQTSPGNAWDRVGLGLPSTLSRSPSATHTTTAPTNREQALEQRIQELEKVLAQRDGTLKELREQLRSGGSDSSPSGAGSAKKARSPGRAVGGFHKVSGSKPVVFYTAQDPDDLVDMRLEEFYNSTQSAIPFTRINKGFYRFGDSVVELSVINHKLMARTEIGTFSHVGWNRGKFGPIEKFLDYFESIERDKAGIVPET